MTELAIGRLANRLLGADPEGMWAAGPVLDRAVGRLPAALNRLLPEALFAAGLPDDAVVAVRRIAVRLPMRDDADGLAHAWAAGIAATLTAALQDAEPRAAPRPSVVSGDTATAPHADEAEADLVLFADPWRAEAELLFRLAARSPLPWWADAVLPDPAIAGTAPGRAALTLLTGWIERDPARFAVALLDLLADAPTLPDLLSPQQLRRLTARLLQRLGTAILAASPVATSAGATTPGEAGDLAAAMASARSALPAALAARLAAIAPERRALFTLAALLGHSPAAAARALAPLEAAAGLGATLGALAAVSLPAPVAPIPGATATPAPPTPAPHSIAPAEAGLPVMNAGLLLLLRPLAAFGAVPAASLPCLLQAIGLAALHRVSQPLPPAVRRTLLERDRALLAVFSGITPPEAPLDLLQVAADGLVHLDALLAAAPPGVEWAPGALRRYYGGADPFGDAPDGRLARILLRPARLSLTRWSADITWPVATADLGLRRAGWDIDPGWLPWIGRVVRFHYDGTEAT